MALYKEGDKLRHSEDAEFDKVHKPGDPAPHAGIYRCQHCQFEIGTAAGHHLPSDHHNHRTVPVRWQLTVYAQHKS